MLFPLFAAVAPAAPAAQSPADPEAVVIANPVVAGAGDVMHRLMQGDFSGDTWILLWTTVGWPIAKAITLIILVLLLAGWAAKAVRRVAGRTRLDPTLSKFFGNVVRWAVLVAGGIASLGTLGIETASLAAAIAAIGFAIGMALSGTLGNAASGVLLLIFRPFKVGDWVTAGGITGEVDEIGLFTTSFNTFDYRRVIVPNSEIFGTTIDNITFHKKRRVQIAVGVSYAVHVDEARRVLQSVLDTTEGVWKEPAPQVYLDSLGDNAVTFFLRTWCDASDYWPLRERLTRNVKVALDESGIGIPFPQRDIHIPAGLSVRVIRDDDAQ